MIKLRDIIENIIESDKEDFLKYHYTGHIPSNAYTRYESEGGLSWLGNKSEYPKLIASQQHGPYTVEYRQRNEKVKYVKFDKNGDILRDKNNEPVYMSDNEMRQENLPVMNQTVVAFIEDKPVGFAANEFGAVGVWVEKPYQRLGIGSDLGVFHIKQRQRILQGKDKLGQMTDAGIHLTKKIYDKLAKIYGDDWFERMKQK